MQRVKEVKLPLCLLLYHMSYSLNLSVAVTKTPPPQPHPPPSPQLHIGARSTVLLRSQVPPTGPSDWTSLLLGYSIRHLARRCDWTQPVQLCK